MPSLDFWYEFASTYSYLSVMRIEDRARKAGVSVRWKPFLLGPIFAQQGWTTTPFKIYPAKGANMLRDMERQCAAMDLAFVHPDPFPINSLLAARTALIAQEDGFIAEFTTAVFDAQFGEGRNIGEADVIGDILTALGHDAPAILTRAADPTNKERLKAQTSEAMTLGIYGAPSFVTEDGELFWGNDRLDQAFDWAARSQAGAA